MGTDKYTRAQLFWNANLDAALSSAQSSVAPLAQNQNHQTSKEDKDRTLVNRRDRLDMATGTSPSTLSSSLCDALQHPPPRCENSFAQESVPLQDHLPFDHGLDITNTDLSPDSHRPQSQIVNSNGQTIHAAFQPDNDFQSWLDPYQDGLDIWNDPAVLNLVYTPSNVPDLPTPRHHESRLCDSKDQIPVERFARVKQLWPTKRELSPPLMQSLWRDVAANSEGGLFSVCDHDTSSPSAANGSLARPWWGLDDDRRRQLFQDYSSIVPPDRRSSAEASKPVITGVDSDSQGSVSQVAISGVSDFPSVEVLNMSLEQYFRRFHPCISFIHRPTFTAKSTPSTLILSMCLIGLKLLSKGENARRFILACVRVSLSIVPAQTGFHSGTKLITLIPPEYHRQVSVGVGWRKQRGPKKPPMLLSIVASAYLLLTVAGTSPVSTRPSLV